MQARAIPSDAVDSAIHWGSSVIEDTEVLGETEVTEKLSPMWKVVCHDDPHTTMDFVVLLFREVFRLPMARSVQLMLEVHQSGAAVLGRWPESVARAKVDRAHGLARAKGFPLTLSTEEDD